MNFETLNPELQRRWQDFVSQAEPPEWVRKMIDHYWQTGALRPEDLQRLLGDPTRGVEVGPNASLTSFLQSKKPHGP